MPNPFTIAIKDYHTSTLTEEISGEISVFLIDAKTKERVDSKGQGQVLGGNILVAFKGKSTKLEIYAYVSSQNQKFRLLFEVRYSVGADPTIRVQNILSKSFFLVSHSKVAKAMKSKQRKLEDSEDESS